MTERADMTDHTSEPSHPRLSRHELDAKLKDLRDRLPYETQAELGEYDIVVDIVTPEITPSSLQPLALREFMRLAGASRTSEIGHHGGPLASLVDEANQDVAALRKFEVLHGRDGLQIALDLKDTYPQLLATTLIELAQHQGQIQEEYHPGQPFRQEEPGKIMLLTREHDDPIGKKFKNRLGWDWPFYGSVDGTPTFISATATLCRTPGYENFIDMPFQGKDGHIYGMFDAFQLSVDWLTHKLDEHPEGLLEFKNIPETGGMPAQAWKDSAFAYVHADGSRANHRDGIASVEVQAFAYDALLDAAKLHRRSRNDSYAEELTQKAATLRQTIFDTFIVTDTKHEPFFALAVDRDPDTQELRQLKVRSSNMGRLLNSRLLEGDDPLTVAMREQTVKHLFSPEMLQFSGIRTLARDENAYRPGGYHTGSVWLHDSAQIADGLERHGYLHLAWDIRKRIHETIQKSHAFLEFVRGDGDENIKTNLSEIYVWNEEFQILHLFEQPPQRIQGWVASANLAMKRRYDEYLAVIATTPSVFEREIFNLAA